MNVQVIRNKKQLEEAVEILRKHPLPLIIATQRIGMNRSVDANEYLWGVVYDIIAKETGQDPLSIHEGYKKMFNFRYEFEYNHKLNRWELVSTDSTASLDSQKFWDFVMKARADAEIDLGIVIPMPNELINNQLIFDHEQ